MYKYIFLVFFPFLGVNLYSQYVVDHLFFDKTVYMLEEAIYKSTQKHALYSYNIANMNTAGFKPILFPEDQEELNKIVPGDSAYAEKVLLEHMSSSMARNRNLQSSYLSLYKKKFDTYRQIATMGKR